MQESLGLKSLPKLHSQPLAIACEASYLNKGDEI